MPAAPLVGLDDVKTFLDLQSSKSDVFLTLLIQSVSEHVERRTGKRFAPTPPFDAAGNDTAPPVSVVIPINPYGPGARGGSGFSPVGSPPVAYPTRFAVAVTIPHAREVDAVLVGLVPLLATQYTLESDSTLRDTYVRRVVITDPTVFSAALYPASLTVTGRFGVAPIPGDLKDTVLSMVARRAKERDAAWADRVDTGEGGVFTYAQFPRWAQLTIDSYCEIST